MAFPDPHPGLVISYSYLWARERGQGREEGIKNRPCAIVLARQVIESRLLVTVLAITHSPPSNADEAIEIPATVKRILGLDDMPSWIALTEVNDFIWPGPTCRMCPAPTRPGSTMACCHPRSSVKCAISCWLSSRPVA